MTRGGPRHPRRWTAANCLTLFRLALAAPAMVLAALAGWREVFLVMLAAAFASDFVDGTVARWSGGTTPFGAWLDSWADGAAYCAIALGVALLWPRLVATEWLAFGALVASFSLPAAAGWLRFRCLTAYHTWATKAAVATTAAALLTALFTGLGWPLRIAAGLALLAALEEILITLLLTRPRSNVGGLWRLRRDAS